MRKDQRNLISVSFCRVSSTCYCKLRALIFHSILADHAVELGVNDEGLIIVNKVVIGALSEKARGFGNLN